MKNLFLNSIRIFVSLFISFFVFFVSFAFADSGINITAPLDGATVSPGQQITVTVEAVGGFTLSDGWVGIPGVPEEKLINLPQTSVFTIPQDAIGTIIIQAAATGTPDNLTADKITLNVQQVAVLESITVEPQDYYFETDWSGSPNTQEYIYINVKGMYSDGITRDISSQGTTYVSSNPAIASVDNSGKVQPLTEGTVTVTVSNSGISMVVPITIVRPQGIPRSETIPPATQIDIQPAPNAAGWNNNDVVVTLNAVDNPGGSGVEEIIYQVYSSGAQEQFAKGDRVIFTLTHEGTDTLNYLAVDKELNQEPSHSAIFNIDKVSPVVTINIPNNGSQYVLNSNIIADWTASDGISGIASAQGSVANGAAIDTSSAGIKNFSVEAIDNAGNQKTEVVTYSVMRPLVFGTIYEKPETVVIPSEGTTVSILNISRTQVLASAITNSQGKFYIISSNVPDGNYIIQTQKEGYKLYSGITLLRNTQSLPFSITLVPPVFAGMPSNISITENESYALKISATDSNGDKLIFGAPSLPSGATFIDNKNNSADFSWIPNSAQVGSHAVNFQVSDGLFFKNATLEIAVKILNHPPVIESIPDQSIYEGGVLQFKIKASDSDQGDILKFSSDNLPQGATLNNDSGVFSWEPNFSQKGLYSIAFKVADGKGGEATMSAKVTVINSSLYGTVRDKITKGPIASANISILKGRRIITATTTDSLGNYHISGNLPTGIYIVRVSARNHAPRTAVAVICYDKSTRLDFSLNHLKRDVNKYR